MRTRERGFAVAAARALGARAQVFCESRGTQLAAAAADWAAHPERLRVEAKRLDRPVPPGVQLVHPSWYSPAPRTSAPLLRAWLERRSYGRLVGYPDRGEDPSDGTTGERLPLTDRLEREPEARLIELVRALGLRRLAIAFSGAPRASLAQLCARLGEPTSSELLVLLRQVSQQLQGDEVRAAQRAICELGADASTTDRPRDSVELLLFRIGAAWLGPVVAARGQDRLLRLAQRLPSPLGRILLDEGAVAAPPTEGAAVIGAASSILGR